MNLNNYKRGVVLLAAALAFIMPYAWAEEAAEAAPEPATAATEEASATTEGASAPAAASAEAPADEPAETTAEATGTAPTAETPEAMMQELSRRYEELRAQFDKMREMAREERERARDERWAEQRERLAEYGVELPEMPPWREAEERREAMREQWESYRATVDAMTDEQKAAAQAIFGKAKSTPMQQPMPPCHPMCGQGAPMCGQGMPATRAYPKGPGMYAQPPMQPYGERGGRPAPMYRPTY